MSSGPQQQHQRSVDPASLTTTPPFTSSSQPTPPSPSTPPWLAPLSVPSSPLSLPAVGTPSSSASSVRSLPLSTARRLRPAHREGTEAKVSPSGGKQWEASVDDSTLRIKLRMANSRARSQSTTPAKRPPPSPTAASSDSSEPQPLIDTSQPPSPTPSSSSSASSSSTSPPTSPTTSRTAASSSRRLPWTATELSALIQGVGKYGKDWASIMRDDKLGRLLRRRTVVACRKQYMFGRAMGQWRKGTRQLPGIDRDRDTDTNEKEEAEEEEQGEEEKENGVNEEAEGENAEQRGALEKAEADQYVHATRARTRGATVLSRQQKEQKLATAPSDDSDDDTDMTDSSEAASQSTRQLPWSNVRADELPPGKQRSEYRRCRHTCGCKGRKSEDGRAVVNKHGRRNHEKSESQHPGCTRRYVCHRLFGSLKPSGEAPLPDDGDEDEDEEGSESEWSEEDEEEEEEEKESEKEYESKHEHRALKAADTAEKAVRPVFGPSFPLPAAPPLYRPSSVLAHSGATSMSSLHAPTLYASTTASAGTRMAVVQSLLDLGPSATQQRQVSAARATEQWMRWKDDSERYEETIGGLRAQIARLMERDDEWYRKEERWTREKEAMTAKVKELEAKVRQLKRSAAKGGKRHNSRSDMEFTLATPVAPQSPMLMATYPAVPVSSSSPSLAGESGQLYHSPSSAFAAVGRAQPAAASPQLPPAQPLGPYWPPGPLPSAQLFPHAPFPFAGQLWGQPHVSPPASFYGSPQHQQSSALQSSVAIAGQGFPSPMSALSLAAQPAARPPSAALTNMYTTSSASTRTTETVRAVMPAITLSPAAVPLAHTAHSTQRTEPSAKGRSANGTGCTTEGRKTAE